MLINILIYRNNNRINANRIITVALYHLEENMLIVMAEINIFSNVYSG